MFKKKQAPANGRSALFINFVLKKVLDILNATAFSYNLPKHGFIW